MVGGYDGEVYDLQLYIPDRPEGEDSAGAGIVHRPDDIVEIADVVKILPTRCTGTRKYFPKKPTGKIIIFFFLIP